MICIFDCETIPDTNLIRQQFALEGDDRSVTEAAFSLQEQKTGSTFLPVPFHQVVSISAVISDDFGKFDKVSSIGGADEREMITNFLQFIDRHNPKLVSFNGRNFDMPMLLIRAMKYNLSCPAFYDKDNQQLGKSKWDNYRYRFTDRFHVDLMDHIGEFGAVRGLKLDLLCNMAGIPGKFDVSGDQVHTLYYEGKLDEIREYCESDVLNTYWLYLKYELLKGNLLIEDYLTNLDGMSHRLPEGKSYTAIFQEGIRREIEKHDGNH